jgi:hypothetical protein
MRLVTDFAGTLKTLQATFVRHSGGVSLASAVCPKLASANLAELASFTFRSDEAASEALSKLAVVLQVGLVAVEFLADDNHPQFVDTQTLAL